MDALQRLYLLLFAFKVRKNPVEGKKRKKKKKKKNLRSKNSLVAEITKANQSVLLIVSSWTLPLDLIGILCLLLAGRDYGGQRRTRILPSAVA